MLLRPMLYKTYIWPHNPAAYSITYERPLAVQKVPFGRYWMQDLGLSCRVMRGWGEFVGDGAYDEFKKLATVFYSDGPGLLIHPLWQISNAYFTGLELEQEPLPDYVRYSFTFRERYDGYSEGLTELPVNTENSGALSSAGAVSAANAAQASETTRYTVAGGDSLWAIAQRYGVSLNTLLAANPGIKNPNLIDIGDKVVVPC